MIGVFALCLILFVGILYDAQIVHGDDYRSRSVTQVTTTKTVETSRGMITDTNGKLLVSNQEVYTVTFDPDQVPDDPAVTPGGSGTVHSESVARALLRLLRLLQSHDVTWDDGLPVSFSAPYTYTISQVTSSQRSRFQAYLVDRKWSTTEITPSTSHPLMSPSLLQELGLDTATALTAPQLLELMRKSFGIPADFTDQEARMVAGVLYELRLRNLEKNAATAPYILAEDVSVELISLLNDGSFAGAVVSSRAVRQYHTDNAAHILGRVGAIDSQEERAELNAPWTAAKEAGEDTSAYRYYRNNDKVGKDGVEKAFETWLAGRDGTRLITTNQEGKITSEIYSIEPEPGGTVALTIDIDFQAQVESILAESVRVMNENERIKNGDDDEAAENTRGAAAAVVSVADSSILALATYPTYSQRTYLEDLEALSADPGHPFTNRAIAGAYTPGSTFKMVTASAGLESGVITPKTIINATGRYMYYYDPDPAKSYTPACWIWNQSRGTHGRINVTQAIYHSCNYFFYEVGRLIGIETLDEYATGFGLGQPTGIEIWERTGTLASPAYSESQNVPWYDGNTIQAAIGQSDNTFTPLQMANYVATLLRGGLRYDAHLLKDVSAYDGSGILYSHEPQVLADLQLSDSTLAAIKQGMGDLVTSGSVRNQFSSCIVSAGAKTGSAQMGNAVTNGVFVCFAPYEDPEIAVAVVIERGGSGSAVASTAVEILNAYFSPSDIGIITAPEGTLLP